MATQEKNLNNGVGDSQKLQTYRNSRGYTKGGNF